MLSIALNLVDSASANSKFASSKIQESLIINLEVSNLSTRKYVRL